MTIYFITEKRRFTCDGIKRLHPVFSCTTSSRGNSPPPRYSRSRSAHTLP